MTTDHAYLTILCVELKAGKFSILSSPDKKCSGSVYDLHCPESIERDDIYDPKKSGPFSKEELTARLQELADMRIMFNPWPEGIVPAEQVNREQSVVSVAAKVKRTKKAAKKAKKAAKKQRKKAVKRTTKRAANKLQKNKSRRRTTGGGG